MIGPPAANMTSGRCQ